MSLLGLPNELVVAIAEQIHPSAIINFACTSKRINACAATALGLHRQRLKKFRVHHDRHPMYIVELLRRLRDRPELTWYIRVFEFYGVRGKWEDWKTYRDYESVEGETVVDCTSEVGPGLFDDLALETTCGINHVSGVSELGGKLKKYLEGDDIPLKTYLIAMCPNLEKIMYVQDESNYQPYNIICDLIDIYQPIQDHSLWPPGFLSLRSISIGTYSRQVHPHDNYHPDLDDFICLFLLPNLKYLRVNVAGYGDNDLELLDRRVPEFTSSVEELALDCCDFELNEIITIMKRCKSLKGYQDNYMYNYDTVLQTIQPWCHDTLEYLRPSPPYKSLAWLKENFPKLKEFSIPWNKLTVEIDNLGLDSLDSGLVGLDSSHESRRYSEFHNFDAVVPNCAQHVMFDLLSQKVDGNEECCRQELEQIHKSEFWKHLDDFVQLRAKSRGGCLGQIDINFHHFTALHPRLSMEMGVAEDKAMQHFARWKNIGVEGKIPGRSEMYDEEILETRPAAREFWQNV